MIQRPRFVARGVATVGAAAGAGLGLIAVAVVAAGCAEDRRFAKEGATRDTGKLVVPSRITPPVTVARIEGAPESWRFNARVAKALRDRDVPAGTHGRGRASYLLKGRAETFAAPISEGGEGGEGGGTGGKRMRIAWSLHDAAGKRVGAALQVVDLPTGAAPAGRPDARPDPTALDAIARRAAARIGPLVPYSALRPGRMARSRDPIWQRVAGAPVTALGKQDAERGERGLSGRFLKLRHVGTVAARTPETASRTAPDTTKARGKPAAPAVAPDRPAAAAAAFDRRSVVTERIAFVVHSPAARRAAPSRSATRPAPARAAHPAVARPPVTRPILTRVAANGPAPRKPVAIRPAPGAGKLPVQVAEAPGGGGGGDGDGGGDDARRGFWVQIASNPSAKASHAAWAALAAAHGALLERQPHAVNRADLGRKGVYYRLQLGPYPNIAQANRVCASLKAAGLDCLLMAARGQVADRTPAARRVVRTPPPKAATPTLETPKAGRPKTRPPEAKTTKTKTPEAKAPGAETPGAEVPAAKPNKRSAARKVTAGAAAAVTPAAGSGSGAAAKRKPALGAGARKPKSRAHNLPFQRSKALSGLTD